MKSLTKCVLQIADSPRSACVVILAAAIVARIFVSFAAGPILWLDSLHYYRTAHTFLQTGSLRDHRIYHTPLYPLLLAGAMRLFQGPYAGEAIVALQHLLGIASCLIFYRVARLLFGTRIAFFTGLLLSLHTVLLYYECVIQTELLFFFFFALFIETSVSFLLLPRPPVSSLLRGALYIAASVLTRPVVQYLVIAPAFGYGVARHSVKGALRIAAWMTIPCVCLLLPWMYENYQSHGFFGVTRGQGINLFLRAFELDDLSPPPESAYENVRREYLALKRSHPRKQVYFTLQHELVADWHLSETDTDELLYAAAREAIIANPVPFLEDLSVSFIEFFVHVKNSALWCNGSEVPVLCGGKGFDIQTAQFPNYPRAGNNAAKWIVWEYMRFCVLPLGVFTVIGIPGGFLFWRRFPEKRDAFYFIAVVVFYFALATAIFNVNNDRYRLPVDPFLLMFALYAIGVAFTHLKRGGEPRPER